MLSVNCAHLGCPVTWFQQSGLFMCPATAASTTPTASTPPARRRAACFTAPGACRDGRLQIQAPHYPTLQDTLVQNRLTQRGDAPCSAGSKRSATGSMPGSASATRCLPMMRHPVPAPSTGPMGWWYVFGSASLTLFLIQILTGIGLALVYVPAADKAYESLLFLDYEQPLGWFLRALHYYAGSGMVVMLLVHMTQVFLHGAYKYPRELTWVVGVFLLCLHAGHVLQRADSPLGPRCLLGPGRRRLDGRPRAGDRAVGRRHAARRPDHRRRFAEPLLRAARVRHSRCTDVLPGGPPLARAEVRHQRAARPGPGRRSATYDADYHKELKTGVPFLGDAMLKDILFSALAVMVVVVIAAVLGPKGPTGPPDPALRRRESAAGVAVPLAVRAAVAQPARHRDVHHAGLPGRADRGSAARAVRQQPRRARPQPPAGGGAWRDRHLHDARGADLRGNPRTVVAGDDGLDRRPDPGAHGRRAVDPVELQGALVFQYKNCRNCHALDGVGGERGPDLTHVGIRMTRNQLIDQVSNGTPGGGNMPAYGKQISPAEMDALVEFLVSLRPEGQPAAGAADESFATSESAH